MIFEQREGQQFLASYYRTVLGDAASLIHQKEILEVSRNSVKHIEDAWSSSLEKGIDLSELPSSPNAFLMWYSDFEKKINDDIDFFIQHLKHHATIEQVAYYICMEELVDGSFDDLMALVQLGMPIKCKMIAAENYWDEMGNGDCKYVHTSMFKTSSAHMRRILLRTGICPEVPDTECLMNGNILLMWALRREYHIRLIGAIGLVEGSAPTRFGATTDALIRLKQTDEVIAYHRAHIGIDTGHSKAWFETVLHHYVENSPEVIRELALGVMIRYKISVQYYDFIFSRMRGI